MKLTVAVLTLNEENMIKGCLSSIQFADEILVIDAQSKDKTVEIAKAMHARVEITPWEGFSKQRNKALRLATNDWILFVDADERVSCTLQEELEKMLQREEDFVVGAIPRINYLLGRKQIRGGWYPDHQIRLIRNSKEITWVGDLHERPVFNGKMKHFLSPLYHLTHREVLSMLEKTRQYTDIEAKLLFEGHTSKVTRFTLVRKIVGEIYRRGIRQRGFLDGIEGWIEVFFQSYSVFIKYVRLWEYQKEVQTKMQYTKIDEIIEKEVEECHSHG